MLKPFLMVSLVFLLGAPAFFQQTPSTQANPPAAQPFTIPPEYVNMANPVKPTPEMQARAQKMYGWDCAMCHGATGNGKGDVAAAQKLTMRDYRDAASLAHYSDGELFYIIKNGKGQMPSEGQRANDELIWNMVILVRKMAAPAAPTGATASVQP